MDSRHDCSEDDDRLEAGCLQQRADAGVPLRLERGGSTYECSLDGAGFGGCPSETSFGPLATGPHSLRVRATDVAGNVDASPAEYAWAIDVTAPETTLGDTPGGSTGAKASIGFSAGEPGSTFECALDGAGFAPCVSPKSYDDLGDGSHSFAVRAVDAAGNVDASPATFAWTADGTPPRTTLAAARPSDPSTVDTASFRFSAGEGATFQCQLNRRAFAACASPQSYDGLAEGSHTFRVRAVDAAGNADASPAAYTWIVDTRPPAVPALDVARAGTGGVKLVATLDDAGRQSGHGAVTFRLCADVRCTRVLATRSVDDVADGGDATWTPPRSLAGGIYWSQAQATDAADNDSRWTRASKLVLERSAARPVRTPARERKAARASKRH